jgi:stage II sporulation protein D
VETFFHSTCGGATERAVNVWPGATQSFPTVECSFCSLSPASRWNLKLSPEELATALKAGGFKEDRVEGLEVKRRSESGRAVLIEARGQLDRLVLDGNTLRRLVGYTVLKSTRFAVRLDEGSYTFEGQGYGHGVGLCQWGARGMALQGRTAEEILDFYYPGTLRVRLEVAPPPASSFGDFYPAPLEP